MSPMPGMVLNSKVILSSLTKDLILFSKSFIFFVISSIRSRYPLHVLTLLLQGLF